MKKNLFGEIHPGEKVTEKLCAGQKMYFIGPPTITLNARSLKRLN